MLKKTFAVALTALALTGAMAATTTEAQAGSNGWAIGAGIAAGALIAGAAAAHAYEPVYVGSPYRSCRYVRRFDAWGNYVRTVRVCDYY
jgi:hypothetical protein